jgi:hypothetical protein
MMEEIDEPIEETMLDLSQYTPRTEEAFFKGLMLLWVDAEILRLEAKIKRVHNSYGIRDRIAELKVPENEKHPSPDAHWFDTALGGRVFKISHNNDIPNLRTLHMFDTEGKREMFSKLLALSWKSSAQRNTVQAIRQREESGRTTPALELIKSQIEKNWEIRHYKRCHGGEHTVVYMQFEIDGSMRSHCNIAAGVMMLRIPSSLPEKVKAMLLALLSAPLRLDASDPLHDFTNLSTEPGYRFNFATSCYGENIENLANAVLGRTQTHVEACDVVFEMIKAGLGTNTDWEEIFSTDTSGIGKVNKLFPPDEWPDTDENQSPHSPGNNRGGSGISDEERTPISPEFKMRVSNRYPIRRLFLLQYSKCNACVRYYIKEGQCSAYRLRMFDVWIRRG